ncbi:PLP-dependent aminotransferase family protein [Salinisphaera sp.]|uniref:aminotransferase-like domain-containing protein n=1 Tax=Salinisphaera sp. TaxID=1914330 RepID=UPI002D768FD7|nr:PLP-dependent aminotransferase family protein [Salinisphaera sp.]HET7313758.1 PLP-dependent aminotransferase family protein [Salinisphaera sp.]
MLYERLADNVAHLIENGVYQLGARLPSVRRISVEKDLSVSTCVRAYHELERRGVIEARPRSGFFVLSTGTSLALPSVSSEAATPVPVSGRDRILRMLDASAEPDMTNFGAASPHPGFMPSGAIARASSRIWHMARRRCMTQAFPPGAFELRAEIARRLSLASCDVSPDDLVITNGCQASLTLALRLVCKPGDVVAVESPTYYGLLEVLEQCGLRALPIPTDPQTGVSLKLLEKALIRWNPGAIAVIPTISNPMGVTLSEEKKRRLVQLAEKYGIPIIEDDVYGELVASGRRSRPLKSWDQSGNVYYCSSATKTISAGLRIGWVWVPSERREEARYQQYLASVSVNTPAQLTLANYLATANIHRHMRIAARGYKRCRREFAAQLEAKLPASVSISRPHGGFLIWVELPEYVDTTELLSRALARHVVFAPGELFSPDGEFKNCLRLNSALESAEMANRGISILAELMSDSIKS